MREDEAKQHSGQIWLSEQRQEMLKETILLLQIWEISSLRSCDNINLQVSIFYIYLNRSERNKIEELIKCCKRIYKEMNG